MRETSIEKDEHIPELRIMMADGERCLSFVLGMSVFAILESANIHIRAACGGLGACGQCRVRIAVGVVNEPTHAELNRLTPAQIQQGIRLACQVRPLQDVRLFVECLAPRASWRSLSVNEYIPIEAPLPRGPAAIQKKPSYGVAVDLGTTQIRLSFWDLATRQRLTGCAGLNPQNCDGHAE